MAAYYRSPTPLLVPFSGLLLALGACPGDDSSNDDANTAPTGLTASPSGTESGETGESGATAGSDDSADATATATATTTNTTTPADTGDTGDETGDPDTLDCQGEPLETLPIDSTGWIPADCTIFEIQGAWYCFDDGVTENSCMVGETPYENNAMCLSGMAMGPVKGAWGGGIGVTLNETGGAMSMKMPYDAAAQGIVGFAIEISGETGGNELRVGFTGAAEPAGVSPFVAVAGPGSHDVMLADAIVPEEWMLPESGTAPDPAAIYDVQVQIATDGFTAPFDFCITSITPIVE